jgi:hypothetical protein
MSQIVSGLQRHHLPHAKLACISERRSIVNQIVISEQAVIHPKIEKLASRPLFSMMT